MRPAVGSRKCVSRLKQVVLPAPLGPMRAWMLPRRTFRATSLTATKPLNSLVSPRVSRMICSAKPPPRAAARDHTSVPSRLFLRWGAFVDKGFHALAPFVVREAGSDDLAREVVGLLQPEIQLLVEGALARGEGRRRLF